MPGLEPEGREGAPLCGNFIRNVLPVEVGSCQVLQAFDALNAILMPLGIDVPV